MAVLLNDVSNLRFRLQLDQRLDPGIHKPATISCRVTLERFVHKPDLEHVFEPVLDLGAHVVLDLDLIRLVDESERLLQGELGQVQFQPVPPDAAAQGRRPHGWEHGESDDERRPPFALQIVAIEGGLLVEVGVDLAVCLEPLGGLAVPPSRDLALFRWMTTHDALRGFAIGLAEEYGRFPTDPSKVDKGPAA